MSTIRSATAMVLGALALPILSGQAFGQVTLIKEIGPGASSGISSEPLVRLGPITLFAGDDGTTGFEVWKTDGTAAGTVLVKDIWPGSRGSNPMKVWRNSRRSHGTVGNAVVFAADDGVSGYELWRSDGTTAGTYLLKDIWPGSNAGLPLGFTEVGGLVCFVADDGVNGAELWKTDGTTQGTVMVRDIGVGSGPNGPFQLTEFRGKLYFGRGRSLWVSDGTEEGTYEITDVLRSGLYPMTVAGGSLWFTEASPLGTDVWKSDGTKAGTVVVKSFPYDPFAIPDWYTTVGNDVFFSTSDGINGHELWKSDGTTEGTVLVKDIDPFGGSQPRNLYEVGGKLVFEARTGSIPAAAGWALWVSDGTEEGTVYLPNSSGNALIGPRYFGKAGDGSLYFDGNDVTAGEVGTWRTDGTPQGTTLVFENFLSGGSGPQVSSVNAVVSGEYLVGSFHPATGGELWKLDPGPTSVRYGKPCAAPGRYPRLTASDPAFHSTWNIRGDGFQPGTNLSLLASFEAFPSAIGPCTLLVDANNWTVFHSRPLGTPAWELPIPLPVIPALTGTSLVLQAVQAPSPAPLGADLSNGVVSTLGPAIW